MLRIKITLILSCFFPVISSAQTIPVNDEAIGRAYSFIHIPLNSISGMAELDSFYQKLYELRTRGDGIVTIVHIGDSHVQADFLPGVVRMGLQQFFGNAGRGLVFPYQLAQSNAPPDISSSSNSSWQFNRIAHPEIPITPGISGYTIQTNSAGASINLALKPGDSGPQYFDHLKFFLDSNKDNSWILQAGTNEAATIRNTGDSSCYAEALLKDSASNFVLSSLPIGNTRSFYGVSLENSRSGILYHTIGVNGVRYDQYNIAPLFWKQLAALHADLFIISLGTNEAQRMAFDEPGFKVQLNLFIQKLKEAAPGASFLITTAADSYKKHRPNSILKQINRSIADYCNQNKIPCWDLYQITNGLGSANSWIKRGLMNRDRIHFTAEGYRIQGSLLFSALAKGFNNYISSH